VTVGEYVEYLNALLDAGEEARAEAAEPRITGEGLYFHRDASGRWLGIAPDIEGLELWPRRPDMPVTLVDWYQARDYAAWRSERSGLPWRLLMEREWQHAARGADQREYPWGDHLEPTWCQMRLTPQNTGVIPVGSKPIDVSPYGVGDCGGNADEWVANGPDLSSTARVVVGVPEARERVNCGGSCTWGPIDCRIAKRSPLLPNHRHPVTGFRISRSWGETPPASSAS
jgi:serine/threonine-protein kinase